MRRSICVAAVAFGARALGAQARDTGRLYPLLEIGAARSLGATLVDRTVTSGSDVETMGLRLDPQWGIVAEGRLPLGARQVWGLDAYVARFRGGARVTATDQAPTAGVPGAEPPSAMQLHLGGVTSWRATLAVARAVPMPARLIGALLLGGTYATIRSPDVVCAVAAPGATSAPWDLCPPRPRLNNMPGVTAGAEVFTRPWHDVRLRLALRGDVLHVDEDEARESLGGGEFLAAHVQGYGSWHLLPSATIGVEFRIPW
jgi:hypothetical protein